MGYSASAAADPCPYSVGQTSPTKAFPYTNADNFNPALRASAQKGNAMPNLTRLVSTSVDYVPLRTTRFVLRLALCVLVTAMNVAVIAYTAPILYRASAHHPVWSAGVSLLFGSLLLSLLRVWLTVLPRTAR